MATAAPVVETVIMGQRCRRFRRPFRGGFVSIHESDHSGLAAIQAMAEVYGSMAAHGIVI